MTHRPVAKTEKRALSIWMEQANRIHQTLRGLIGLPGNSAAEFMNQLCCNLIANKDTDVIHEYVVKIRNLQNKICMYQNEVLALAGIREDFEKVDVILREGCMVVGWVKELLCVAIVYIAEVKGTYETEAFSFQEK